MVATSNHLDARSASPTGPAECQLAYRLGATERTTDSALWPAAMVESLRPPRPDGTFTNCPFPRSALSDPRLWSKIRPLVPHQPGNVTTASFANDRRTSRHRNPSPAPPARALQSTDSYSPGKAHRDRRRDNDEPADKAGQVTRRGQRQLGFSRFNVADDQRANGPRAVHFISERRAWMVHGPPKKVHGARVHRQSARRVQELRSS